MADDRTSFAVQRYLDDLAAGAPADAVVRDLLDRAARRLHLGERDEYNRVCRELLGRFGNSSITCSAGRPRG